MTPTPYSHYLESLIASLEAFFNTTSNYYSSSGYSTTPGFSQEDYGLMVLDRDFVDWHASGDHNVSPNPANSIREAYNSVEANVLKLTNSYFKTTNDWDIVKEFLHNFNGSPYTLERVNENDAVMHNGIWYSYCALHFVVKNPGMYPSNLVIKRGVILTNLNKSPAYKSKQSL